MIDAKFAVVAQGAAIDRQDNQLSVFEIIEGFEVRSFPIFIQRISFVVLWERNTEDPVELDGYFSVCLGEAEITRQACHVNFQGLMRQRSIFRLNGFQVQQPGILNFKMELMGHGTAAYSIEIVGAPVVTNIESA